jgi:hypothetical protein
MIICIFHWKSNNVTFFSPESKQKASEQESLVVVETKHLSNEKAILNRGGNESSIE